MTPPARAEAAILILDRWLAGDGAAEALLRSWGRSSRYAGSGDRRAVADIVYDCVRRRRSLDWRSGAVGGRGLVQGLFIANGSPVDEVFTGGRYAPATLSEDERATEAREAPDPVALDYPDWLDLSLRDALGDAFAPVLIALSKRAPVDLRVNRLKSTAEAALSSLRAEGFEVAPSPRTPDAIRCPPGARIAATAAYRDGLVEPQDESSQAGALYAGVRPGASVLDYCAGGGGKALAFASHMRGRGAVVAHDVDPRRMDDLPQRAARAGADVEIATTAQLEGRESGFDIVFVDAPCSGSGAWRRDPEAKWNLTKGRLNDLLAAQRAAFAAALRFARPGGAIIYATCSILREENEAQAARFAATFGALSPRRALNIHPGAKGDGFFCAGFDVRR